MVTFYEVLYYSRIFKTCRKDSTDTKKLGYKRYFKTTSVTAFAYRLQGKRANKAKQFVKEVLADD